MMMNLFSVFDPSTSMSFSVNWTSALILPFLYPYQYWVSPSRYSILWDKLMKHINKEFSQHITHSYSNIFIISSLFTLILINNCMGLVPYIFTATSHLSTTLSLSLTLWSAMVIHALTSSFTLLMAHLTPLGTPTILMPFMVMIETISLSIRPLTLAIRLSANMITGHLLLSLLGTTASLNNLGLPLLIMLLSQMLLLTLEISISIIQSYVFSTLLMLYKSEI